MLEETQNQNPSCIFDQKSEEKKEKIQNNSYLKYCFEQLSEIQGELFLIGWSCSDNDNHLTEQISKSKIEKLYISYHDEKSRENFSAKLGNTDKEITFFKSELLPFS